MAAPSARGLFAAMGMASKPVAVRAGRDLAGVFDRAEYLEREENEFYPTPPAPTRAFLAAEAEALRRHDMIWEPAAGDGAMVRELQSHGHRVFASDLVERGCGAEIRSFYDYAAPAAPAIVTNPPFAECTGGGLWIRHAMQMPGLAYMALLLPFTWPGAARRGPLLVRHPLARVYLIRWRVDFTGQGASPMTFAWFVWDRAAHGPTQLRYLDRADARQGDLFPGAG